MANHVQLNNVEHKELRVITDKAARFGNNQTYSLLFPFEFKHAQAEYPIFFLKDPNSGELNGVALFGFEANENLFLSDTGWNASYIPMMVEREPFLIGMQANSDGSEPTPVIHIDLDNPRVSQQQGTKLFLEHGGNSDYINRISTILKTIHDSKQATKAFIDTLQQYQLLEPFNLDIQLSNGSNNRLTGFHTINEDKLAKLNGEQLATLNQSGMLTVIFMVIASYGNIPKLIAKKDELVIDAAS